LPTPPAASDPEMVKDLLAAAHALQVCELRRRQACARWWGKKHRAATLSWQFVSHFFKDKRGPYSLYQERTHNMDKVGYALTFNF
jgi:hypothetical protein